MSPHADAATIVPETTLHGIHIASESTAPQLASLVVMHGARRVHLATLVLHPGERRALGTPVVLSPGDRLLLEGNSLVLSAVLTQVFRETRA